MLAGDAGTAVVGSMVAESSEADTSEASVNEDRSSIDVQTGRHEIMFVDEEVENLDTLIDGISKTTDIVLIHSTGDALDQMTRALSQRSKIDCVHIVSHGSAGKIQLAGTTLDEVHLRSNSELFQQWQQVLSPEADILLYACEVAYGRQGEALIEQLSQLSGADVAASTNLTGHAGHGGDWNLELATGAIESVVAFDQSVVANYENVLFFQERWGGHHDSSGSKIEVVFHGDTGHEQLSVEVDGEEVAIWGADTWKKHYTILVDHRVGPENVRINFLNDVYNPSANYDRNLHVDAIAIDGVWHHSESPHVLSTGTWTPENGIVPGFHQSETLHTTGYFQYGTQSGLANVEARTEFGVDNDIEFLQDPSLAYELVRVTAPSYPGDGNGAQWDAPEPGSLPQTPPNAPTNIGTAVQPLEITDRIYAPGSDQVRPNSAGLNDYSQFFGQFVTHDMVHSVRAAGPPIFYDGQFIPVSRTPPITGDDGILQQVSSDTPSLDLGLVYGKDAQATDLLREYKYIDGHWVAGAKLISGGAGDVLPSYAEVAAQRGVDVSEVQSILGRTFLNLPEQASINQSATGDERANQTASLTAHHTVWHRNHNWHVDQLRSQHSGWSEEQLYQAARAMNEAEYQKVIYDEYLPLLLGQHALSEYSGYDSTVDPRIINEWTTVAFRFGHDNSSDGQLVISESGEATFIPLPVSSLIANNGQAIKSDGELGDWLRGQLAQNSQEIDGRIAGSLRDALFGVPANQDGNDGTPDEFLPLNLPLLDVHRGRDHGVSDYNALRSGLGLKTYESLDEFAVENGLSSERLWQLKSVYNDISELDSIVGGLLEAKVHDSQLGETFTILNVMQFENTRDGDPYFYKNRFANSPDVLSAIEGTSMSSILVRVGAVDVAPDNAFQAEPIGSVLQVNAAGQTGDEILVLEIGGERVKSWKVGTEMETFTFRASGPIDLWDVRIAFQNDAYDPSNHYDRNLQVDNIILDGVVYETEAGNVYSTGTWDQYGLSEGFKYSEILHVNGYFQYV